MGTLKRERSMIVTLNLLLYSKTPEGYNILPPKTVAHHLKESHGGGTVEANHQLTVYLGKQEASLLKKIKKCPHSIF